MKFTGDGVMAIFGAATAHEDDPERAVRSALGICERVAEAGDADLHVRVGVTSGEALVTPRRHWWCAGRGRRCREHGGAAGVGSAIGQCAG